MMSESVPYAYHIVHADGKGARSWRLAAMTHRPDASPGGSGAKIRNATGYGQDRR
jgi:hypothetical protein